MMMMMTANQCPRVSGNNAIGCEKFTDASSRNCTLAIIFVRIFIVFLAIIIIFDAIFIVSAVVIVIIIMNWGFVSLFNWRYTNTNCALNWQAFYTFLYLYRGRGKHVLIHAHISPLWYIWARCTLSMIKYLVLGICVTKLFIGIATLCTAFWLTHKSDSLGFVAERFKCCVIIDNTFDLVQYDLAKYFVWISKPSLPPTTNLPLPIICCQMQFFHRRINLFSLKPHFLSNYPIFTRPLSFAEPIFTRTMNNENHRHHWHDPIWSPRRRKKASHQYKFTSDMCSNFPQSGGSSREVNNCT